MSLGKSLNVFHVIVYCVIDTTDTEDDNVNRREKLKSKKQVLVAKDYFRLDSDSDDGAVNNRMMLKGIVENLQKLPSYEIEQIQAEEAAGDPSEVFGTNTHKKQSSNFVDFGRRFVLQYPYQKVGNKINLEDNDMLENNLIPVKASPELVLAVAKQSAILNAAKAVNPTDDLITKDILRTGNYWNSYWKEEGDPEKLLRINKNKMKSMNVKLSPGTEIYEVLSKLQLQQPKLLYIINKKDTD